MSLEGLFLLLLYIASLTALGAGTIALCVLPFVCRPEAGETGKNSSRFWFLLGVSPLLAGTAVGGGSLASAILKGISLIPDHCQLHPGHPHLCWTHAATSFPGGGFLWVFFAGVLGVILISVWKVGRSLLAIDLRLRQSSGVQNHEGFQTIVSGIPAAFVAGVFRPRVYLTTSAVELLTPGERQIVISHEREHIRRYDPLKLALLRIVSSLFPGFGRLEEKWKATAEIECDRACLDEGSDAVEVSMTILKLARATGPLPNGTALAYAQGSDAVLRRRIETLLADVQPHRSRFRWGLLLLLLMLLAAGGLSSAHHVLETVLGIIIT